MTTTNRQPPDTGLQKSTFWSLWAGISLALAVTSCSKQSPSAPSANVAFVQVDNGSPDPWQLFIDGKESGALPPHAVVGFELTSGKHQLRITRNADEVDHIETNLTAGRVVVINPAALSRYAETTATYTTGGPFSGEAPSTHPVEGAHFWEGDFGLLQPLPNTVTLSSLTIKVKGVAINNRSVKTTTRTKLSKLVPESPSVAEAIEILTGNVNIYGQVDANLQDTDERFPRAFTTLTTAPPTTEIRNLLLKFAEENTHTAAALAALKNYEAEIPETQLLAWQSVACEKDNQGCYQRLEFAERVLFFSQRGEKLRARFASLPEAKRTRLLWAAAKSGAPDFRKEIILAELQQETTRADDAILAIFRAKDFVPDEQLAQTFEAFLQKNADKRSFTPSRWKEDILIGRATELRGPWFTQRLLQLAEADDTMAIKALIQRDDGTALATGLPKLKTESRRLALEWQADRCLEMKQVTAGARALFRAALTITDVPQLKASTYQLARTYRETKDATLLQWLQAAADKQKDFDTKTEIQGQIKWATSR